jgi:hypothetical protein
VATYGRKVPTNPTNMRVDPLTQFTHLRRQLIQERAQLETRLAKLNELLAPNGGAATNSNSSLMHRIRQDSRRVRNKMSLRETVAMALVKGPLSRKQLVHAVKDLGYVFRTDDPLNSMGVILYAKDSPFKRKDGLFFLPPEARQRLLPS